MRRRIQFLFLTALFAQAGGQPVPIPIPETSFSLGYGQTKCQTLAATPAVLQASPTHPGYFVDGVYDLSFSVVNQFPPYPGYYTAEVSFGTQELCEASRLATRVTTTVPLVCGGPSYIVADQALPGGGPVQGTSQLEVCFSVPSWSWPVDFDHAAFNFTALN